MGGWSGRVMGQKGFFDVERRLEAISAKGDPLETMRKMVRWEDFRADIEAVTETKAEERNSNAGRKPYDTILKFKILVLQSLHNLSDEQTEYLIRDRLSFMRFLDLELEDPVPDATTIWLFREALAQAGLIDQLSFPKISSGRDSCREAESSHHSGRCFRGGQTVSVRQFLARQRGGRRRKGGIRAAARALGLTRHRLGSHHGGLYKGCSGEHTYCQRNHGTVQTQTSTTPHDQSGTQGTRHSGTGAGHHADHQAADEDQTAVRTLR